MSLPRMSLHIGDYLKDTGHLDAAQHGAYLLLIMHYWTTGGLPDDDAQLSRISCTSVRSWKRMRPVIAALFKEGWKHSRIDAELVEAKAKYDRRVEAGRKGGQAKAAKPEPSNARAMLKQPITLTNKEVDVVDEGRAEIGKKEEPQPLVSSEAMDIATKIGAMVGYPTPDDWEPQWMGSPYRVQAWLSGGWKAELILIAAKEAIARKRDGPPKSINYFEGPIASAHAKFAAPLPKVHQQEANVIHVNREPKTGSIVQTAKRQLAEELAEYERKWGSIDAGERSEVADSEGDGSETLRLVSKG